MKLCKKCNTWRTFKVIGLGPKARDESGRKWRGNTCGVCTMPPPRLPRPKKELPELNTLTLTRCRVCLEEHARVLKSRHKSGTVRYSNLSGSAWVGRVCPTCAKISRQKEKVIAQCLRCGKDYHKRAFKHIFCSRICHTPRRPKKDKIVKPRPVKEVDYRVKDHCKLHIKKCTVCDVIFTTSYKERKFCSHRCSRRTPRAKESRKRRKKAERFKQPISSYYILELIDIYQKTPDGMEVDHIIPRRGENVCGLHVPWNLQYLTPEENRNKSNKT